MTRIPHWIFLGIIMIIFPSIGLAQSSEDLDKDFFQPTTTIGGYGELHYNSILHPQSKSSSTMDFHRFVLFLSHTWTEKLSLKSEIEIEHNLVEPPEENGALELEQAYLDYHASGFFGFQAGVILPTVGLLNQYHEPPLFFGVERPNYSKKIIPTTWFGNGISFYGTVRNVGYRLVLMEGLQGTAISPGKGIREARQEGVKSDATHPLLNLSLEIRAIPDLVFGASVSFNQVADTLNGRSQLNRVTIFEGHTRWSRSGLIFQGEAGQIKYGSPELVGGVSTAAGYYLDFGYDLAKLLHLPGQIIPWLRYNYSNTAAGTTTAATQLKTAYAESYWQTGLQFKPIHEVVYKLDYGVRKLGGTNTTLFNMGIGYMF